MDLGFGSFLEKFEQHFGLRATKAFLVLIGLAVCALCLGAIWQWLIAPLLDFLQSPNRFQVVVRLLLIFVAAGGGMAIGLMLTSAFKGWRIIKNSQRQYEALKKRSDELIERGEELGRRADGMLDDVKATQQRTSDTLARASALVAEAKQMAENMSSKRSPKTGPRKPKG